MRRKVYFRCLPLFLLGALLLLAPQGVEAQIPPVVVFPLPEPGEGELPDPEIQPARQVLPRNLPSGEYGLSAGEEPGVWIWDREALLTSPFITLHDLLSQLPGLTLVRGGDFGAPTGISAFGLGAGQVRLFLDGVEDAPMEGGVLDLTQVGLTGLSSVRVERGPAELRIHLSTARVEDVRPSTLLEVATGDFKTNLFRVGFLHPNALGGTLLVALDRLDTEGPERNQAGAAYGSRFRYTLFPREGTGLAVEYRSRTARRPPGQGWDPLEVQRSEWSARLGMELTPNLTAELHGIRSSFGLGDRAEEASAQWVPGDPRTSLGGRLSWTAGPLQAWGSGARRSGEGWPALVIETGATLSAPRWGGLSARYDQGRWSDEALEGRGEDLVPSEGQSEGWSARIWTPRFGGLSLFAEMEHARRGRPFVVPAPTPGDTTGLAEGEVAEPIFPLFDPVTFFNRDGTRLGANFALGGLRLTGARLQIEADALPPLGLPFDRGAPLGVGGTRTGYEVEGALPLSWLLSGLTLSGSGIFWDEAPGWRYLPDRSWMGRLGWYKTGYDGKLEIWGDVGVRGRDPMVAILGAAPQSAPELAPFTQSWFARLQVRVVTVRVFVQGENLQFREGNADLPDRFQPQFRVIYGIRWTMWN